MPWICPSCKRKFKLPNQSHSCTEIDIDSHFINKSPLLIATFQKLLSEVKKIGMVNISPVKSSIMFKVDSTFCSVKFKKESLVIEFFLDHIEKEPLVIKILQVSQNRIVHIVNLYKPEDVNSKVIKWLKESYQLIRNPI